MAEISDVFQVLLYLPTRQFLFNSLDLAIRGLPDDSYEIREAISLSLNLEALVTRTSLALHPLYPPTGRGPTSFW